MRQQPSHTGDRDGLEGVVPLHNIRPAVRSHRTGSRNRRRLVFVFHGKRTVQGDALVRFDPTRELAREKVKVKAAARGSNPKSIFAVRERKSVLDGQSNLIHVQRDAGCWIRHDNDVIARPLCGPLDQLLRVGGCSSGPTHRAALTRAAFTGKGWKYCEATLL